MPVQSAGPVAIDPAVRDQGADHGQAKLAAMRVTGEEQLVTVGDEPVEHSWFWRMHDPDAEAGGGVRGACHAVVPVAVDVRVVHAGQRDVQAAGSEPGPLVI